MFTMLTTMTSSLTAILSHRLAQRLPPVSFFGMAVGTLALGQGWLVAERTWLLGTTMSTTLAVIGTTFWALMLASYLLKWCLHPTAAMQEIQHPQQSSLAALGPVSSLLVAITFASWSRPIGLAIVVAALVWQGVLGLWIHGRLWQGGKASNSLSAVAYLPAVAQNFVAAMACAAFGWTGLATLFLGAGFFSWLALESMIMHRATVSTALPVEERPTLGIQMAPAVVGGVAYTSIHPHAADLFAMMLLGYGLYQFLILLRLMPWIRHQRFVPSYWSFSFGIAALSNLSLRLYERTHSALMSVLSIALLAIATGVITLLIGATLRWAWRNATDKGDRPTNDITQTTNP